MRNKNIVLMISSVLALMFVLGMGSAAFDFNPTSLLSETMNSGDGSITVAFDLVHDGAGPNYSALNWVGSSTEGTWSLPTTTTLLISETKSLSATLSNIPSNFKGTIIASITLDDAGSPTDTLPITITVTDITSPTITLIGDNPQYVRKGGAYTELGATATDNVDGNITSRIVIDASAVNVNTVGSYTVTYNVNDAAGNSATQVTRTVVVTEMFCTVGSDSSDLELSVDIKNKGQGKDNEWLPLDTVEIEVKFKNDREDPDDNGAFDLEDVTFEIGLFEVGSTNNIADELIWLSKDNEEFEFGDVDEGKKAEHIFKFRIDPSEVEEGNYMLMIKAYPAGEEASDCIDYSSDLSSTEFGTSSYYASIAIDSENSKDKMVIIDTELFPDLPTASCEQEVTFTADIWNIGNSDFADQVKVTLLNTALGVDDYVIATGDLDAGEKAQVTFTFDVPEGTEEKTHNLAMKVYYDYDSDDDEYDEVSEDEFIFPLKVEGNCGVAKASLSATLESGGRAGEILVVKTTVTNTGTENTTYTFSVTDYSDWASSATINNTLTLASGESKDITATLEIKKGVSGDQTFNIETYSDGKLVSSQPVQVSVEGKKGFNLQDNESLVAILIALISAIVVAIIIVLIVRAARR